MNSNGKNKDATPFHWTLLPLDRKQGQWMHGNSMRPREKNAIDHYFKDAELLKRYVENYNFVNIKETQPYNEPLLSMEGAPQQKQGLLDCGIIVCYIMIQIAYCNLVHHHLAQSVVNSFREKLTVKFLHDETLSWTKEDFEAKKFASLKEG
ncbi:hypothetical protein MRB53_002395 [Persea americana]|uniref:Uncharacterized protein n=1 Tax=Persea americana TaxID=3435 RepID=A0ACC2MUE0_PERAE|nr:hypothetical protein MRB53_002395 [Persea americana]